MTGMSNEPEVKILNQGPDRGNLTPRRQGHVGGKPAQAAMPGCTPSFTARACLKEAIGVLWSKRKRSAVKRSASGESVVSDEAQFLSVVRTYWRQDLDNVRYFLPSEICRVPRER